MAGWFKSMYDWLMRLFWATEMDITMIGLQNAGKTSLLRVLAGGEFTIEFIVDSADEAAMPIARDELHALLEKHVLDGIPLLVLGNKSDLPEKLSVDDLIDVLDLKSVSHREVSCYGISAKEETNLDAVLQWLIARSK
ncbi:MAG: hypothetical protein M1838_000830 [Thelocarpon superellum]|nr:MAG: hypothetical protein M1838_000830 [Thelocarpon superellum]